MSDPLRQGSTSTSTSTGGTTGLPPPPPEDFSASMQFKLDNVDGITRIYPDGQEGYALYGQNCHMATKVVKTVS